MSEKQTLVQKSISYSGDFEFQRIYKHIPTYMQKKGFSLDDEEHSITATQDGRNQDITFAFSKSEGKYDKALVDITFTIANAVPKKEGTTPMQTGDVTISMKGHIKMAREGKVGRDPISYFFNMLGNKLLSKRINALPGKELQDIIFDLYLELDTLFKGFKDGR